MEAMTEKVRVLLVDDDAVVRSTVGTALREAGYRVRAEADGAAIETVAAEFRPDLAILDLRLPVGPDGYEIAGRLRNMSWAGDSDVPFLFLTSASSEHEVLAGFRAGAEDYLLKPFRMTELVARAEAVLRRSGRLFVGKRQIGDLLIDPDSGTVSRNGNAIELSPTEYKLLSVLAHRPGRMLSKEQILTKVWGFDYYDTNLVEVYVGYLRHKLEAHGPRLLHTVRGRGYRLQA